MSKRIADAFKNGKAFIPFITAGDPSIEKTKEFFYKTLGLKSSFSELGITDEHFAEMAKKACGSSGTIKGWKNLTPSDVEAIYRASL